MALAHRHYSQYQHTNFPVGDKSIDLRNETIKSYLPTLWSRRGRWAQTEGYLDLEGLGLVGGPLCRRALLVILKALKKSENGSGVGHELKGQLQDALVNHTHHTPSPEHTMSKIFSHVARLIRKTGQHREMAYAMSDWFNCFAARNELDFESRFWYIVALDQLQTSMTGPLLSLLRQEPLTRAEVQLFCRYLGARGRKELQQLWKNHKFNGRPRPRRPIRVSADGVVLGGDVGLEDVIRRYNQDPDSIVLRFGRRHRRIPRHDFEADDDYSTDTESDTSGDDEYCPYAQCQPRVHDPSSFHPIHGLSHVAPRYCGHSPFMVTSGIVNTQLLEAGIPGHMQGRPSMIRGYSSPYS
ncbi:MAG: hypothetical protein Q9221_001359 [Calogaya cf. arnoldii]